MPEVSVIIPVYQVENYLSECLDSVLAQTFTDIEIICVNDASGDRSLEILETYAAKDGRIKIISHAVNQGLGAARNSGLAIAAAPCVAFIDSDDYVSPDFIAVLYKLIKDHHSQMSWCGMNSVSGSGSFLQSSEIAAGNWSLQEILDREDFYPSILSMCNKMFLTDLIRDIKQLPMVSEDQPALAEYFNKCERVSTTEQALYYYRQNTDTLSKPLEPKAQGWDDFFLAHALFLELLSKRFPAKEPLRKQAILRHFSVLWRIKSFKMLGHKNWEENRQRLIFHLKQDRMQLKLYSPLSYWFLMRLFRRRGQIKLKKAGVTIGLRLLRQVWIKKERPARLPLDLFKAGWPFIKQTMKATLDRAELGTVKAVSRAYLLLSKKPVWLLAERPDTAQDNGYHFFKYLRLERPDTAAYYVINKSSGQYQHVKPLKRVVHYNGFLHKVLFEASRYYVSSHNHYCFPRTLFGKKRYSLPAKTRNVFLQHGITYSDNSDDYGKGRSDIDLIICGAQPEYEFIKSKFGYAEEEVCYTGFSRFDDLHDYSTGRTILLMPTWRKNIWKNRLKNNHDFFLNSAYYKTFQSLINNEALIRLLEHYDFHLVFYPHYEIQPYIQNFHTGSERIVFADKDKYNIQDLLKSSALLVTDTSSVNFDFAYMGKPLLHYLFDSEDFSKSHMRPGYFKHETMGFGKTTRREEDLVRYIEEQLEQGCRVEALYKRRVAEFFPLHDKRNSERIFEAILKMAS